MKIKTMLKEFSIYKVGAIEDIDFSEEPLFIGKTKNEISVVTATENISKLYTDKSDGYRCFFIDETLDFSLIGILADVSRLLAENKIAVLAISTYNTDYFFVKGESLSQAVSALKMAGYEIEEDE